MEDAKKIKIVIVDDDPLIVEMYKLKFEEQGFEVSVAMDGKTGLAKIKEVRPHVVLLDVVLPAMDGFEIFQAIQQEPTLPKPKVIFLTNFGQKNDVDRGMELGADGYIIKAHFTPSEVVEKVKSLL